MSRSVLRLSIAFMLTILLAACDGEAPRREAMDVNQLLGSVDGLEGFERAIEQRQFRFPRDHGPHPEFLHEWWYVTGHGRDADGHLHGFQITIFRNAIALSPPDIGSAWTTNQVWMAHLAITDGRSGEHRAEERFARGVLDLAGAQADPFAVWLGDWRLASLSGEPGGYRPGEPWRLAAGTDTFALDLLLTPVKEPVFQGDRGLSQKSPEPGNASYYYSMTRMESRGTLTIDGTDLAIEGLAWLDREWGTSALGEDQRGWDWFSLQLDDGRDLMFYRLRDMDNHMHPSSKGSWVDVDGSSHVITPEDIQLVATDWWRSPATGKRYPVAWRLNHPALEADWRVRALHPAQEMDLSVIYWEGLVEVIDAASGERLGLGYMELAGY